MSGAPTVSACHPCFIRDFKIGWRTTTKQCYCTWSEPHDCSFFLHSAAATVSCWAVSHSSVCWEHFATFCHLGDSAILSFSKKKFQFMCFKWEVVQGLTLTFQFSSLVASDKLDVTRQKIFLLAWSNNSRITSKTWKHNASETLENIMFVLHFT